MEYRCTDQKIHYRGSWDSQDHKRIEDREARRVFEVLAYPTK